MTVKEIAVIIMCVFSFSACAQSNSCLNKTYGFSRSVLSGVAPTDAVEVGGGIVKSGANHNKQFFIYLQTCTVNSVTISSVYINGTGYSGKAQKANTPVILTNTTLSSKGIKETLVPKTSMQVWELVIEEDPTLLKPGTSLKKIISDNAVVVTGYLKGKVFTAPLKSLKELQPLAGQ